MTANPRRVAAIRIDFQVVVSGGASDQALAVLEKVGRACPVARSLHPDLKQERVFLLNALNAFLPWVSPHKLHIAGQWCHKN